MKVINDFLPQEETNEILNFNYKPNDMFIKNKHIKEVNDSMKGWSILCNFSKNEVTNYISKFQGDSTNVDDVPNIFWYLSTKIADVLNINNNNIFFQYIYIGKNGQVKKHYDAGMPGFITYKANIVILGPKVDYIYVGKDKIEIKPNDLYAFEANFYKHWLEKSDIPRIHLSYGFILPYEELGYNENDPRVKLSNKIWKKWITIN